MIHIVKKQKGGLLAKGRLLGLQFLALLEDGLYLQLSDHANQLAKRIRNAFQEARVPFLVESNTNQLFPPFLSVLKKGDDVFICLLHLLEN